MCFCCLEVIIRVKGERFTENRAAVFTSVIAATNWSSVVQRGGLEAFIILFISFYSFSLHPWLQPSGSECSNRPSLIKTFPACRFLCVENTNTVNDAVLGPHSNTLMQDYIFVNRVLRWMFDKQRI